MTKSTDAAAELARRKASAHAAYVRVHAPRGPKPSKYRRTVGPSR